MFNVANIFSKTFRWFVRNPTEEKANMCFGPDERHGHVFRTKQKENCQHKSSDLDVDVDKNVLSLLNEISFVLATRQSWIFFFEISSDIQNDSISREFFFLKKYFTKYLCRKQNAKKVTNYNCAATSESIKLNLEFQTRNEWLYFHLKLSKTTRIYEKLYK